MQVELEKLVIIEGDLLENFQTPKSSGLHVWKDPNDCVLAA